MKERIAELDMVKGFLVLYVIISHVTGFTGVKQVYSEFFKYYASGLLFDMAAFYILSGYTYSQGRLNIKEAILKRAKSMLLPYYGYAIPMIVGLFIVYGLVEKRALGWFVDGLLAIIFQLQSVHLYGGGRLIHEMMYCVLPAWFIFQLMVSFIVFVPIYHFIEKKSLLVKLATTMLLLGLGALFYSLDIQQLNGRIFPPVCKAFILPNIWGIAGLIMLGKCLSILDLLNLDKQGAGQKTVLFIVSLTIFAIGVVADDHIYDFPIGKWGAFRELSYFLTPVFGAAMAFICVYIANLLKSNDIIKKTASFFGKNSLDFMLVHFFWLWFVLYVMGAWYPTASGVKLPPASADIRLLNFAWTFTLTLALSYVTIVIKKKLQLW